MGDLGAGQRAGQALQVVLGPIADRVAGERDWQASEADLIEQTIDVPIDDDFDR
mgnify:CR=1 FL=1